MLELIKEWLEFYELDYTTSTLLAEAKLPATSSGLKERQALLNSIHLPHAPADRPILVELLTHVQNQSFSTPKTSPTAAAQAAKLNAAASTTPVRSTAQEQHETSPPSATYGTATRPLGAPSLPRGNLVTVNKTTLE